MIRRLLLVSAAGLLLAGVVRGGDATPAGAGLPPPVPAPAGSPELPEELVRKVYAALADGRAGTAPLAEQIDVEALLERVVEGLSARPPEVWMAAARERLDSAGERNNAVISIWDTRLVEPHVLGTAKQGGNRATVTVRCYRQRSGMPVWHRVQMVKRKSHWWVADIHVLNSGRQLSTWAISSLGDPAAAKLPTPGGAAVLASPVLLGMPLLAILLGLGAYYGLVRPAEGKPRRGLWVALAWLAVLVPLAIGLVIFAIRLTGHVSRTGAVEELERRARSLRDTREVDEFMRGGVVPPQAQALLERALAAGAWPANPVATVLQARLLAAGGGAKGVRQHLQELTKSELLGPAALLELAKFHEKLRNWRAAAESMEAFVERVGPDGFACSMAAQLRARAGDSKRADQMLRRAEKAEKPDQIMLLMRAQVRVQQKRGKDAVADLRKLLKPFEAIIEKNPAPFLNMCGQLLNMARQGQFDPVRDDPDFKAYFQELLKKRSEIIQKLRPPRRVR